MRLHEALELYGFGLATRSSERRLRVNPSFIRGYRIWDTNAWFPADDEVLVSRWLGSRPTTCEIMLDVCAG